ncbi:hypothetical protein H2200_002959 [Cladophialophora chaetospira]|uniref:Laccase n=1 Tax=Cladophialophora chaetospira TaxID=386627 RepID=A0AA38XGG0_9EURO|nr:hypothetical protein H2200_002959 [Cladophialophora chaetospira]
MVLLARLWTTLVYVASLGFLSPSDVEGPSSELQAPLIGDIIKPPPNIPHGPIFKPPGGRLDGPGSDFQCDYSAMVGWSSCSTPENRGCWLRNDVTGKEYNISTNYEDTNQTPIGIHRTYYLNVTDGWVNATGMNFTDAKLFNNTYPGPWIQGCWGDNVTVIVKNNLVHNGTSIHWHGIRQLLTTHMDGVNGVTQCPVATGDSFNYTWRALQYGSSWYHSHYSVQYADGAVGPITLHGPSSAPYDEPKTPLLMTDWGGLSPSHYRHRCLIHITPLRSANVTIIGHNSAFDAVWKAPAPTALKFPCILLNGRGNVTRYNPGVKAPLDIPTPYSITFDPPTKAGAKRYLLRIINTSFEQTFVFSIDNHLLQIVGSDFVPIHPYTNTSVLVGIGQRYHVIVEADPKANLPYNPVAADGNYWIRTERANCFGSSSVAPDYMETGILRYNASSKADPQTTRWGPNPYGNISLRCSDETYSSLRPIVPWTVGPSANAPADEIGESFTVQAKPSPDIFPLAIFSIGGDDFSPLMTEYSDPTFLKLNYTGKWNPLSVVIVENYTSTDWIYFVIKGKTVPGQGSNTIGAHPIHLHGHDFAILQQIENATYPDKLNLKRDNPPRRDVVLLPTNGYVVIAFKADNPGIWLVHCHIAYHASMGLGMQILERQQDAATIWPSLNTSLALRNAQNGCDRWNKWWGDCSNWWFDPAKSKSSCGLGEDFFAPDSGI